MKYLTHIPTLPHAQREQMFRAERAEARESVIRLSTMRDTLVRASEGHLQRNFVDAGSLERCGRKIVKLSNVIRHLGLTARQPDPPRYEPVTQEITSAENRLYGGVKASRLVRVLAFFKRLRAQNVDTEKGNIEVAKRVMRLSQKLTHGLDVYNRVKALITKLIVAVDAPDKAMTPRKAHKTRPRTHRTTFTWEKSPQKVYGWTYALSVKGYDLRQTSVYWLEKQAVSLKRDMYRDYHGVQNVRKQMLSSGTKANNADIETRIYVPPQGAQVTDDIWPPIDLVRMIEVRKACHPAPNSLRTNQLDAGPRENLVGKNLQHPRNVSGSRTSLRLCGMTSHDEGDAGDPPISEHPP